MKKFRLAIIICVCVLLFLPAYASAAVAEEDEPSGQYAEREDVLTGYVGVTQAGGADALAPNESFIYRYQDKVDERAEYEERKRQEALEAKRIADEERRLNEMRQRVASLTDDELNEIYPQSFFVQRLKDLGFYKQDSSTEDLNYRNAVIRLQAAMNLRTDATLGELSKKSLVESSPLIPIDEVSNPASSGYWITINKTKNILTVYRGSEVHHKYPVATGARPTLTPEGKFSFVTKSVNPAWGGGGYANPVAGGSPSNPLGKRWLGLSVGGGGSYGVHGNASPYSIGTFASHGCVRMINSDVESMYDYIPVGTPVWIGTDDKLASFGVKQYYHLVMPEPAAEVELEPEPEPEPDPREAERAVIMPLVELTAAPAPADAAGGEEAADAVSAAAA